MSSIGTVEGYLKLTDDFTAVLDRAMGALGKSTTLMKTNLAQMNQALDMTGKAAKQMGAAAKKAGEDTEKGAKKAQASAGMLHDLRAAYAVAAIGIWQFIDRTVAAQQASDRMRNSLLAGTGDMRVVGEELAFIRSESNRLGLDLATTGVQYGKLTAASKGTGIELSTIRATFTAVAEAATALGLSSEDTTGALNAVVQMMTKGTVQAEELRGQLGDRVPGAVQAMARALGVGNDEMMKMLEQGKVITAEVLPRFAEELAKIGGAGVEAGMTSFNAELNRLKTSLFDLFTGIAGDISLPNFVKNMQELVKTVDDLMRNGGGAEIFSNLSTVIGGALGTLGEFLKLYVQLKQLLDAGLGAGGSGLSTDDFTPVGMAAGILDRLKEQFAQSKAEIAGWSSGFQGAMNAASNGVFAVSESFKGATTEAERFFAEVAASGKALTSDELNARAASDLNKNLKERQEILENLVKHSQEYQKANSKAFDLQDKLKNQAKELEIFQKLLKENGGDFALAKKNAASYYAVLMAGLDPLKGLGKVLYDLARANDTVSESLADEEEYWKSLFAAADKTAKDLETKTAKSLAAVVERANKAIKQYQTMTDNMVEFRTEADRYWGSLDAASHGADALREFNKEAEIQDEILRRLGPLTSENALAYGAYAAKIRDAMGAMIDHRNWVEKTQAAYDSFANAIGSIDYGSAAINDAVGGLAKMISSMGKLRTANKMFSAETVNAWGDVVTGAVAVVKALEQINTSAISEYGGKMSGNYAAAGSAVGALVGAAIAAYFTAGTGTAGGAAIGSAIGEAIGSMINKGADEGLIRLQNSANMYGSHFAAELTGLNIKVGRTAMRAGQELVDVLNDVVNSLGGAIAGITGMTMKIRDKDIIIVVDGIRRVFQEMGDAVSFAATQILKTATYMNLDPLFEAALRGNNADNLEGLKSDLEAVSKVINFGFSDSTEGIHAFENELDQLSGVISRTIMDVGQAQRGYTLLANEEIRRWQSSRDALTGDKQSNAEKLEMLKADAMMWNAEKALRIAELQSRRQALVAQAEMANAEHIIGARNVDSEFGILKAHSAIYDGELQAMTAFAKGAGAIVEATLNLAQVQIDAIDGVISALQNMPDINIPTLHLPGVSGPHGGNSGPSEAEQRATAFVDFIKSKMVQGLTDLGQRLYEINKAYDEQRQAAIELGRVEELEAARIAEIARIREDFLEGMRLDGLSDYQRALAELNKAFADQALLNPDLVGGEEALAAARRAALNALRDDLLNSFGTPMEALRDRIADFQQRMQDLAAANAELANQLKNGEIGAREYADAIAHSDEVLNDFVMGLKSELLNLALYFTDAMGDTQASADIRRQLAILEWQYKKLELRMMIEAIRVAGGFGTAASNAITTMFAAVTAGVNSVVAAAMPLIDPDYRGTLPGDNGGGGGIYGGPGQIPPGTTPPAGTDPNNPGQWTYEQWIEWLNSLPDLPPMADPNTGDNGNGGSGADPTDELLDRLLASIEDLRRILETYQDFLTSLERGPLSGATLQNQFNSAQSDFMEMLAAAQGGDMQAIRDLPGMAEEFLSIAAQYLDPASAEYQRILAMIQSSMGGIAGGLGDIINAAPESALGSNGVLDTIQEILAAMALRWGVDPGWNTGNLVAGGFDWHPNSPGTSDSGLLGSRDLSVSGSGSSAIHTDRVVSILTAIDRKLDAGNELVGGQTNTLKREIGRLAEQKGQMGYAGPVRRVQR